MRFPRPARLVAAAAALVLAATLAQPVVHAPPAQAGPSEPLPTVASVPVTGQSMAPLPADAASTNALSGNQPTGGTPPAGGGTVAATPLAPSASWDVSLQTGDFSWSYPLRVPPAPGGLEPSLALSYRSSAVDGRTSATNNQASWIGDGWDLNPGFVERTYGACATDTEGGTTPPQNGDLCWRSDNASASYGGGGGMLIKDGDGFWRTRSDDGSRVERLTGAANGDEHDGTVAGEHWKITTTDGTQYHFGSAANSTWTVPVYGDDANEPCRAATYVASRCMQAWRWNLDKVVDRHGNVVRYTYATETNNYGPNLVATAVTYARGGTLSTIEYGFRDGGTPSAQVVFTTADRCVPGSTCTSANPQNWPDVPWTESCTTSTCAGKHTPSFWSTKRLSTVTTQVRKDGVFADVDRWTLDQQFPDPGDGEKAALWLKSITHTGLANGGSISLPAVTFHGTPMANRVDQAEGIGPLNRYRVSAVVAETGGLLTVDYADPDCTPSSLPSTAHLNDRRCYPVTWAKPNFAERTDHFHKHVVEQIVESDRTGAVAEQVTSFEYLDGAAWHWDMSEFTKDSKKTWNEFRGFSRVRVRHGNPLDLTAPRTMTEQRFHRGMHGDRQPVGTRAVQITDSSGATRPDHDWLQGFGYESTTYDGAGATPGTVARSFTDPVWQGPTASRGDFHAYIVRAGSQRAQTALAAGGWRTTQVDTTYDDRGIATRVHDQGDVLVATDDRCTTTTYVRNTTAWLLAFPSRVTTDAVACGTAPTYPQHAVSDTLTSYDLLAHGAAPTVGDATVVRIAKTQPAVHPTDYVTVATATYDAHGRVTSATDALSRTSTTSFVPATGGPVTSVVATNALNHSSTTLIDPAWGVPTRVTDANNQRTESTYDALGRVTEVWLGSRPKQYFPRGNARFAYDVRNDAPTVVTTTAVGPNGVFVTSKTLYDGLLRARQQQSPAASGGGRLLVDTRYDSHGRVRVTTAPYFNSGAVDGVLSLGSESDIPSFTVTEYDGAGRTTASVLRSRLTEKSRSTTTYGGDRVTTTPPAGGTTTTMITNGRGQVVEKRQHSSPTTFDATTYTYAPAGQLATLTDPAGNVWSWQHDVRGRLTGSTDPDRGTTTTTYDDADQVLTTTDARGDKLTYAHDALGRKTSLRSGPTAGTLEAEWVYDTVARGKGHLASSTRYSGGFAYTRSITAYNGVYQPMGVDVAIPAVEGGLAGIYNTTFAWDPDGTLSGEVYPGLAGVARRETVNYVYDDLGQLTSSSGAWGGTVELVTGADYTPYGQVERYELGFDTSAPGLGAWQSFFYDEATGRLDRSMLETETPSPIQSDVGYTYDQVGNVTSVTDSAPGQATDRQCFEYDHLRRLTEAWTPAGSCAAARSAGGLGGPAPYWHSYGYDVVGNRVSETRHAVGGDTTSEYAYDGAQPHAVSSVETTLPGGTVELDTYGYDAAGNTTSRSLAGDGETFTWNAEGRLASSTKDGETTTYLYDADGNRLMRKEHSGAATLYIGDQEFHRSATGQCSFTRYYTDGAGRVIGMRQGSSDATSPRPPLTWLGGDHQGTSQLAMAEATGVTTKRRQLPFGGDRGPAVSWPGERGFLGGAQDASTGLTHLGAREYDPSLGRFLSVDPVLQPTDPQQLQGYAYAHNNPVTWSDPTGLLIPDSCPDGVCTGGGTGSHQNAPAGSNPAWNSNYDSPIAAPGPTYAPGRSGTLCADGVTRCRTHSGYKPVQKPRPALPTPPTVDIWNQCRTIELYIDNISSCMQSPAATRLAVGYDLGIGGADIEACGTSRLTDVNACKMALLALVPVGGAAVRLGRGGWKFAMRMLGRCVSSFEPGTRVVLADGTTAPIEDVEVGDSVLATDVETGRTEPRVVVRAITSEGTKDLVRVSTATGSVVATDNHPFWVEDRGEWLRADELAAGDHLLSTAGERVAVTATAAHLAVTRVHNLTVEGVHTYSVLVGDSTALTHNDNCVNWSSKSVKTFGHTFTTHSAGAKNTQSLKDRARAKGPQGQWLDNDAAAEFLKNAHVPGGGEVRTVPIPDGLGQVIMPDGSVVAARVALLVPGPDGLYRSAYPVLGSG